MQQITVKEGKKLFVLLTLAAFFVSTALPIISHADPITVLAVEPAGIMRSPGETFTVNVTVTDVVDLGGFELNMSYNPDVLNVTSIAVGSFFPEYFVWKNQSWWWNEGLGETGPLDGQIWFSATVGLGSPNGKTGNGTLATVTFIVKPGATGTSPLDLWGTSLATIQDPDERIEHDVSDGQFSIGLPIADFDYSPNNPQVGDTVTFNASKSFKAGGTIISYEWDFGDGTTEIYTETGGNLTAVATHPYSEAKDYNVNLTITDDTQIKGWKSVIVTVSEPQVPRHDVAIVTVGFTPKIVTVGNEVSITVETKNNGTFTETFSVTVYYSETQIDIQTITDLSPGQTKELAFTWNTAGVSEGLHIIKAEAGSVAGESEADKANNLLGGGTIRVNVETETPNTYLYVGAIVGIAVVAGIAFYLLKIRKSKTT